MLMTSSSLNKLGASPLCHLDFITSNKIIINLGDAPTVIVDDSIIFNDEMIKDMSCTSFIKTFHTY
jgi:hypothetical protein